MSGIKGKKLRVVVFAGMVGMLSVASAAWACTFQPRFVSLTDQAGPKGSTVTVTGQGAAPGGAIELRWNGVKGPQLAAATADDTGSFTAMATVPDVAPDIYSLVVVAKDGISRAAFEVTPDAAVPSGSASPVQSSAWADPVEQPTSFGTRSQPVGDSSSNFGAGAALLGLGMTTLASAAGIAAVRRRRASVTSAK